MPETRVFNESVFHSYANLQNFLNRSPAVQEVLSKKDEPYTDVPVPIDPNLTCQWQVCQVVSAPFRWILFIFLKVTSAGLETCGQMQPAKEMKTWAVHVLIGFDALSEETTKLFKIATSVNSPNNEAVIVNEHPSIPESRVARSLRERMSYNVHRTIKFGHREGICKGESLWFLYLYLKTKHQFTDPRAHVAAIAEQFANGGGVDPTLIQSISLGTGNLLNLKIGTQAVHEAVRRSLIQYTPSRWRANSETIIREIKAIPAGAYAVGLPKHLTAFLKINDRLGYFFDPNHGAIEIQGNELAEKFYEKASQTLIETGDGESDFYANFYTPFHVDFEPVTLRA